MIKNDYNDIINKLQLWLNTTTKVDKDGNKKYPTIHSNYIKEHNLAIACSYFRDQKQTGKLADEYINKLNTVVPKFEWNVDVEVEVNNFSFNANFEDNFDNLKRFIGDNGYLPTADGYFSFDEDENDTITSETEIIQLIDFVEDIKLREKKLTKEQRNKVNSLCPVWEWKRDIVRWKKIQELIKFVKDNHKFPKYNTENDNERRLANFYFKLQKQCCGGKLDNKLDDDTKSQLLNALGFIFT